MASTRAHAHQVISDKYELLRVVSSGGMGSVWVAHNRALDNHVAIKQPVLTAIVPSRQGRRVVRRLDTEAYRCRNVIERWFGRVARATSSNASRARGRSGATYHDFARRAVR